MRVRVLSVLFRIPDLGTLIPNMGILNTADGAGVPTTLADALFTPVQQRVLGLLFGQPKRRFQSADLIRLVDSGTGATHRVVKRLAGSGLVVESVDGRQKYYQANPDSPVFDELVALIRKTVGLAGPLRFRSGSVSARARTVSWAGSTCRVDDSHIGKQCTQFGNAKQDEWSRNGCG